MALRDLLEAMRRQAESEIARNEHDSRNEAAEILAAARREASSVEDEILHRAQRELEAEVSPRLALARLGARRELRAGRAKLFGELLQDVRSRLSGLREEPGYRQLLSALLLESVRALPSALRVHVDPRDAEPVRALAAEIGAELDVAEDLRTAGGVELETGDGRRLRNTLETRLSAAEPELRLRFARIAGVSRDEGEQLEPVEGSDHTVEAGRAAEAAG